MSLLQATPSSLWITSTRISNSHLAVDRMSARGNDETPGFCILGLGGILVWKLKASRRPPLRRRSFLAGDHMDSLDRLGMAPSRKHQRSAILTYLIELGWNQLQIKAISLSSGSRPPPSRSRTSSTSTPPTFSFPRTSSPTKDPASLIIPKPSSKRVNPDAHPYAIKTTSTGILSRSSSSPYHSTTLTQHHYDPPTSSPSDQVSPKRYILPRESRHGYSRSSTFEEPRLFACTSFEVFASFTRVWESGRRCRGRYFAHGQRTKRADTLPSSTIPALELPEDPKTWSPTHLSAYGQEQTTAAWVSRWVTVLGEAPLLPSLMASWALGLMQVELTEETCSTIQLPALGLLVMHRPPALLIQTHLQQPKSTHASAPYRPPLL
ncbi:hypothetical protein K443DRAFT_15042 [Laccaria amethystina LaAM-08-1]|uniref:Uncharacterized protein n=1 Tax=Laccaria amethystina LaAM-08-1 TaxID=1095629 RepID=A0A0C9X289_9AGAR|nr:hypothetical protein K443DRAFT_15042 [Laccaria amethystina LaAM-08-1]